MYWTLFIVILVLSTIVQSTFEGRFRKYSKVQLESGLSGAEVAERMLRDHGIRDVSITCVKGKLTDHYDPRDRTINLSREVYEGRTVAAAAVAAHETGHAVQHYLDYAPLRLRSALVPAVNFANKTMQWVILLGFIFFSVFPQLLWAGIGLFAITTLFSIVTLPVEVNASARAVSWLEDEHITGPEQIPMAKSALRSAAYTYFIAALSSIATLLYYIGIAKKN